MPLKETYHQQFTLNIPRALHTIIVFPLGQGLAVDIRGKVTHSRLDSAIQRTTIRKVSTQTHPRGADATIARRQ